MTHMGTETGRTWYLDIPQPTKQWLNLNGRTHWRSRHRLNKAWIELTWATARNAGLPALNRIYVIAEVFYTDRRRRDTHNLMPTFKAAIDGLVKAGIIPDDNDKHLIGPFPKASPTIVKTQTLRLHIIELES